MAFLLLLGWTSSTHNSNLALRFFSSFPRLSRSPGSGWASSPILQLLTLPAAVDGLGAGTKFTESQCTKSQLKVLRDLPSLGPDLLQPLNGCFGEAEVTDGGMRLHSNTAPTHGWEITLGPNHHLVLTGVQKAPVVPVSSYSRWTMTMKTDFTVATCRVMYVSFKVKVGTKLHLIIL